MDLALREFERARELPIESPALGRLLRERAHGPHAGQHFGRRGAGFAVRVLHVGGHRLHAAAEQRRGETQSAAAPSSIKSVSRGDV